MRMNTTKKPDYTRHDNIDSYLPMSQEQADIIRYFQKSRSRHHFFLVYYPTARSFSMEFEFRKSVNGKFAKFKIDMFSGFDNFLMIAYPIEFKKRKFANI